MKYIILLGDGMADEPIESLGGKTPLAAALTPNMDRMAADGVAANAVRAQEQMAGRVAEPGVLVVLADLPEVGQAGGLGFRR